MYLTDEPIADFNRLDREQQRELERRPVCVECDEHIQENYFFEVNGECVCTRCMIDNHRKGVNDYVE